MYKKINIVSLTRSSAIVPAVVFCVLTLAIGVAGYAFFKRLEEGQKALVTEQLISIGKLKASQINTFLHERKGDVGLLAKFLGTQPVQDWLTRTKTDLPAVLEQPLDAAISYGYQGLLILDSEKTVRFSRGPYLHLAEAGMAIAARAMRDQTALLSDIYFGDPSAPEQPMLDVFAPIMSQDRLKPIGVLLLRTNLDELFQLIQSWPVASETAESLLARADSNDALFLNELRFKKNTALKLRVPLNSAPDSAAWPTIQAVLGHYGALESFDYSNQLVVAYTLPVPNTHWSLIVKVSYLDMLEPIRRLQKLTGLVIALFIGFIGVGAWWRKQQIEQHFKQRTEQRVAAVIEFAPDAMVITDADGIIALVNQQVENLFGYPRSELIGQPVDHLVPDRFRAAHPALRAKYVAAPQVKLMNAGRVVLARRKDGSEFDAEVSLSPIQTDDSLLVVSALRDITERRRTEEVLRIARETTVEAEKMAALGGLVAGVAHEINTPVGVNLASATHLQSETRRAAARYAASELSGDELEDYFATAAQAVELMVINSQRAADLIQSFKQVAVDQTSGEQRQFDLRGYIDEVLLSLRPQFKHSPIQISVDCPPGILVDSLPGAVSQILVNLILNALSHAFDEGQAGKITIRAALQADDTVELMVADDGKGIPENIRERIFDPFFTTRRGHGGSGLGLNIAYNVALHALGGSLAQNSGERHGTAFILRFPRVLPRQG